MYWNLIVNYEKGKEQDLKSSVFFKIEEMDKKDKIVQIR